MTKNSNWQLVLTLAFVLALPGNLHADCMWPAQRHVTITIQSCEFLTISNEDRIEEYLDDYAPDEQESVRSMIGTISGLSIMGTVQAWQEIPYDASDGGFVPEPDELYRHWETAPDLSRFFYETSDRNKCNDFEQTMTFFDGGAPCCDNLPGGPSCYVQGIWIRDLPE